MADHASHGQRTDSPNGQEAVARSHTQTKAAARLLLQLPQSTSRLGNNRNGLQFRVGTLGRLLKEYKAKNFEQLYARMGNEGLGFAGRNFYSELLAATLVEAYKEKIFSLEISPDDVAKVYKHLAPFDDELCQVR
ncbi:MAG: hypothetical protein R3B54_08725 [Bdellovibrionota bacterium]